MYKTRRDHGGVFCIHALRRNDTYFGDLEIIGRYILPIISCPQTLEISTHGKFIHFQYFQAPFNLQKSENYILKL